MSIVIDGIMGAGKSTQITMLEEEGYKVKREPVEDWPLEKFYRNKAEWCFLFQVAVLQSNLEDKDVQVYERGILPCRMVFWQDLLNKGIVRHSEEHYWYDKLWNSLVWYPKKYIFIDVDIDVAMGRISNRHQSGDKSISREFLARIDERYREMLKTLEKHCEVHIIDGNGSYEDVRAQIKKII